jgi:hypothetical protein
MINNDFVEQGLEGAGDEVVRWDLETILTNVGYY